MQVIGLESKKGNYFGGRLDLTIAIPEGNLLRHKQEKSLNRVENLPQALDAVGTRSCQILLEVRR